MRNHVLKCLLFAAVATIFAVSFSNQKTDTNVEDQIQNPKTLNIVTTFYPIGEFAREVGGEHVRVTVLTPAGTEPHEYEPTPQQIASVYQSDIFFLNGGEVDVWATDLIPELSARNITVTQMSSVIDLLRIEENGEENFDPHFWLDPLFAVKEVELIRDTLSLVDPAHKDDYAKNSGVYIGKLLALNQTFSSGLATCDQRTVVASHDAFSYLANRYHFDVLHLLGLSPEEEPSAGRLAEIATEAKQKGIRFIYFETLVSPKLSETIAREIGANTLVFNPIEGLTAEQTNAGETYISLMQENLKNLKIGMLCHD